MPNLEEHISAFNVYLDGIRTMLKGALSARNIEIETEQGTNRKKDKIGELLSCFLSFDPVPVGTVIASYASEINGYLLCDGHKEKAKDYPKLYECLHGSNATIEDDTDLELPNLRGKFIQGADITNLGETVDPALPNIKGDLVSVNKIGTGAQAGAFIESTTGSLIKSHNTGSTTPTLSFDASKSNRIYNDDCNTVQPPAVLLNYFIKY